MIARASADASAASRTPIRVDSSALAAAAERPAARIHSGKRMSEGMGCGDSLGWIRKFWSWSGVNGLDTSPPQPKESPRDDSGTNQESVRVASRNPSRSGYHPTAVLVRNQNETRQYVKKKSRQLEKKYFCVEHSLSVMISLHLWVVFRQPPTSKTATSTNRKGQHTTDLQVCLEM